MPKERGQMKITHGWFGVTGESNGVEQTWWFEPSLDGETCYLESFEQGGESYSWSEPPEEVKEMVEEQMGLEVVQK